MALKVRFRAVGVYCFFPSVDLPSLDAKSTVEAVMDEIAKVETGFSYTPVTLPTGKKLVAEIDYDFDSSSVTPPNASGTPASGPRDLSISIGSGTDLVWQYYRSASGTIGGQDVEINIPTKGQPSYADLALGDGFVAPTGFTLETLNLTWRIVQIQMSPENKANYLAAQMELMKARAAQ